MEGDGLLLAHKCRCRSSAILRMRSIVWVVVMSYVVAASFCVLQMQCTAAGLTSSGLLQEHHLVDVDEMSRPDDVADDQLRLKHRITRSKDVASEEDDGDDDDDDVDDREDRLVMSIMNTDFFMKDESGGIDDEMQSESVSFRPGWRPVRVQYNVLNFGALGDGVHNDTDVCHHPLSLYIVL